VYVKKLQTNFSKKKSYL